MVPRVILVLLLVTLGLQEFSYANQSHRDGRQTSKSTDAPEADVPEPNSLHHESGTDDEKKNDSKTHGEKVDGPPEFTDRVSAFIYGLLVNPALMGVISILLFCIAVFQYWTNRQFFYLANRPRIQVGDIKYPEIPRLPYHLTRSVIESVGDPEASFEGVNVGGTEATLIQGFMEIRFPEQMQSDQERAWKVIEPQTISSGNRYTFHLERKWSKNELQKFIGGGQDVFLLGAIRYKDQLGIQHETGFCRQFIYGSGFQVEEDPNYEYEY